MGGLGDGVDMDMITMAMAMATGTHISCGFSLAGSVSSFQARFLPATLRIEALEVSWGVFSVRQSCCLIRFSYLTLVLFFIPALGIWIVGRGGVEMREAVCIFFSQGVLFV